MSACVQCGGEATSVGTCLECVLDVADCTCPKVERPAVADPFAGLGEQLARHGGEVEHQAHDDMPPHPADDPSVNGARRGILRAVRPGQLADDDDGLDGVLAAIPPYPVGALVGPLRDFVEWAVKDGLPAAAAGAAGLAALATVTGRAELALSSTFAVRPALWVTPVGGTGTGKSPALDQAFSAIDALYLADRDAWDEAAKMAKDEPDANIEVPPKPESLTLGDVTLPSAARWLQANGGAGCLVYDELAAMLAAIFPADRAKLCEAWTARRALHIQRVGDGAGKNAIDIYVGRPVLSIFGPLTPDSTKELGKEGDGFRARWLVHLIDGQAQLLDGGPHPKSWTTAIGHLYAAREPRQWKLTGRARTAYELACQRWRVEQDEPYPQSVVEALRKADAQCARIALVIAESCEAATALVASARRNEISLDAMRAAIALTDYVMDCWKALPGSTVLTLSMAEERMSGAAEELFTWLENRQKGTEGLPDGSAPRPRATRRDIQRARVGGAVTPEHISAMLDAYDRRWPGNVATEKQPGRGGNMRVFYYFPRRASRDGADAVEAVTVTASGAHLRRDTADDSAGRGVASDAESCHKEAVTRSCDSFPVTASTRPAGLDGEAADEWPTDPPADLGGRVDGLPGQADHGPQPITRWGNEDG